MLSTLAPVKEEEAVTSLPAQIQTLTTRDLGVATAVKDPFKRPPKLHSPNYTTLHYMYIILNIYKNNGHT